MAVLNLHSNLGVEGQVNSAGEGCGMYNATGAVIKLEQIESVNESDGGFIKLSFSS